jgi:AraC family transcriptional regulator, regulatory protein of adaptative response / methylated-DNA-[protein]-cysteine methyltransferase
MNDDQCWDAVRARDARADGRFYYGVLSTGVYCRPSCPARLPLRSNVRFYTTPAAAEAAGLRPCKRCRPLELRADARVAAQMQALCRYIEAHAQQPLTLEALSARAHLSPFHLQRQFKAAIGVTPRQYLEACRLRTLRAGLRDGRAVTRAIHDAGFGSASRVYERVATRLGMTPKQYRGGGAGVAISYASAPTPLGLLMIGATDRGVCFVQFGDSAKRLRAMLEAEYPAARITPMDDARRGELDAWMHALTAFLHGGAPLPELPLDLRGTAFQMKVWSYLQKIPSGELQSYGEVAQGIGSPTAVRAVASACAANRVALLVPCHRVIRGDGSLGGYKWGLERKRTLIDHERSTRAARR